jgi:glycosyltransferase involved in cell wall biosynthesis
MRLAVDATNLRTGGGVTHLANLLSAADPISLGISHVGVWASAATLEALPHRPWLALQTDRALAHGAAARLRFQTFGLAAAIGRWDADALFIPGGLYPGAFRPFVTMFRNMLPFAPAEAARYGFSPIGLRLRALRPLQKATFERAAGVICLSRFAADVLKASRVSTKRMAIIPHGVGDVFRCAPRAARPLAACAPDDPFRLVYVSIIDLYKHQWNVAEAVLRLRQKGLPISLTLVGPSYPPALRRVTEVTTGSDAVRHVGPVSADTLPDVYARAEGFVFASTCENMPNILLEAMASGLPIACSSRPPMPEVLGDAGLYFDPENVDSIERALVELVTDTAHREALARSAFEAALPYSWTRCATDTFTFIHDAVS